MTVSPVSDLIVYALRTILAHPKNPESFAYAKRVLDFHDASPLTTTGAPSMSLEAILAANTAALEANTAAILANAGAKTAGKAPATPAGAAGASTKAEDSRATDIPDYEKVVRPAVLGLADAHKEKGREVLLGVLAMFPHKEKLGVTADTAKDVKPEQYVELLAAVKAAMPKAEPALA